VKLHNAPGTHYEYANDGYSVAGFIVQKVSGVPYEEYMDEHIFSPLGMRRTTFDPAIAAEWGLAERYTKRSGTVTPGPLPFSRAYAPAGMLVTDSADIGRYLRMLLNRGELEGTQVISSDSLDQMWTAQPATGENEYGLGWGLHTDNGMTYLYHAGDLAIPSQTYGSSSAQFLLVPTRHIAVGVLANMSSAEKSQIAQDAVSVALGGEPAVHPTPPDWRHTTFTADRAVWSAYIGEYVTPQGPLRVYREGDKLRGFAAGTDVEFVPMTDTQFVMLCDQGSCDEVPVEFRPQPDGSVTFLWTGAPYARKAP
jgi:CubicO group peptidase (beta-lactamase class C family)